MQKWIATVGCLAVTGLVVASHSAHADVEGNLVTCTDPTGTTVGQSKLSPSLNLVEKKVKIGGTYFQNFCTANEAELDEIAAESKIGVTKTQAAGRPPIAGATVKLKLTTWADCLGTYVPNDGDDTGEYPIHGIMQIDWISPFATSAGKSTAAVRAPKFGLNFSASGVITKGVGTGADFDATFEQLEEPSDDSNGNTIPDLIDCINSDATAQAKLLKIRAPATMTVAFPSTP